MASSGHEGQCYSAPLRDEDRVICIAVVSGITPCLAMAMAIASGCEYFELVILYGSRREDNFIYRQELAAITAKCPKVRVVHVLSEETKDGFEHGFINAELISRYAAGKPFSVFMCGPSAMYEFVTTECDKLGLDTKHLRVEVATAPASPAGRAA